MPASADVGNAPPSPPSPLASPAEADVLCFLAETVGVSVLPASAAQAYSQLGTTLQEPLERLVEAAERVGLTVEPFRIPLADAVWLAREAQPLVVWQPASQSWLVLRRHGFFKARVTRPERPLETEALSRAALAERLGVRSAAEVLDFGLVRPSRPAEGLRGRNEETDPALLPIYRMQHGPGSAAHESGHGPAHVSPIRRFWGLMRPELPDIWTLLLFSLITGVLYLALPLAVNSLVSNLAFGTQSAPFQQALIFIALALFGCLMLSAIMRGLQYVVAEHMQCRLFVRVAADMAWRLPRVRAESLDGIHAPEMVNRFLDVVTVQKSTSLLLLNGINIIFGGFIGLVVLGFYHPFLLAFTLVMLVAITFIVFGLGRGAVRTSTAESIRKYDVVNWLEEIARYPRLFKGPGGYTLAAERADQLARAYLSARASHFRILMRQISGLLLLEVFASAGLLIVGGGLVLSQQLTLGQLVASELIVSAVVASIAKLGKQFEAWYDALAAVDKLGHVVDLDTEREDGETPDAAPAATGLGVSVQDLAFHFPDGRDIFAGVHFELPAGGRMALTGPQGSGCSTLLDLLVGLREPSHGRILVGGLDLRSWHLERLRQRVMLLRSQDIVNGTLAENVRLGLPGVGLEDVQRALADAGLLEDVLALPQGLHTPLVTGGLPLSSRQRHRLLLARALALKPRLLLLDEVLDGLDPDSTAALTAILLDPQRPWSVVIATRDPDIAARCPMRVTLTSPASAAP